MFAKKLLLKISVGILVILCITISAVVFFKSKGPAKPVKSEQQLREEAINNILAGKGRSRAERREAEPNQTAVDANATQIQEPPEGAIIAKGPEDINSAIADLFTKLLQAADG